MDPARGELQLIRVALREHGCVDLHTVHAVVAVAFADDVEQVAVELAGPVVALPEPAGVALAVEGELVRVGEDVGAGAVLAQLHVGEDGVAAGVQVEVQFAEVAGVAHRELFGVGGLVRVGARLGFVGLITRGPGGGEAVVHVRVQQLEAAAAAGGQLRPVAAGLVIHLVHEVPLGVEEAEVVAVVAQLAGEVAQHVDGPVEGAEQPRVCGDDEVVAGLELGVRGEDEVNAAGEHPFVQVHRLLAAVEELHILALPLRVGGLIHDLVDHDVGVAGGRVGLVARGLRVHEELAGAVGERGEELAVLGEVEDMRIHDDVLRPHEEDRHIPGDGGEGDLEGLDAFGRELANEGDFVSEAGLARKKVAAEGDAVRAGVVNLHPVNQAVLAHVDFVELERADEARQLRVRRVGRRLREVEPLPAAVGPLAQRAAVRGHHGVDRVQHGLPVRRDEVGDDRLPGPHTRRHHVQHAVALGADDEVLRDLKAAHLRGQ